MAGEKRDAADKLLPVLPIVVFIVLLITCHCQHIVTISVDVTFMVDDVIY